MDTSNMQLTTTEQKVLDLLGTGLSQEVVASAVGLDPSRISQLLADENFRALVTNKRYETLNKHNQRDAAYDDIEDTLVTRLKQSIPLMVRPLEILKAVQVINGAKRKGQSAPSQITNQQTIVNITLPGVAVQKFVTNAQNQVVQAGDQELLTIQSGHLLKEAQAKLAGTKPEVLSHVQGQGNEHRAGAGKAPATSSQQGASQLPVAVTFIPAGS